MKSPHVKIYAVLLLSMMTGMKVSADQGVIGGVEYRIQNESLYIFGETINLKDFQERNTQSASGQQGSKIEVKLKPSPKQSYTLIDLYQSTPDDVEEYWVYEKNSRKILWHPNFNGKGRASSKWESDDILRITIGLGTGAWNSTLIRLKPNIQTREIFSLLGYDPRSDIFVSKTDDWKIKIGQAFSNNIPEQFDIPAGMDLSLALMRVRASDGKLMVDYVDAENKKHSISFAPQILRSHPKIDHEFWVSE